MAWNGQVEYQGDARVFPRRVFFTGSTALVKGQGLCYDHDRGTSTTADATRQNYVEVPTTSNGLHFAGVTAKAYDAKTGGQWITIYEPGSTCQVAVGIDTAIGQTMTCSAHSADAGRFTMPGFIGRGTAMALQATINNRGQNAFSRVSTNNVRVSLKGGLATLGTTTLVGSVTLISAGSSGTLGAGDTTLAAGDKLVLLTGYYNTASLVPGTYTVSTVVSNTQAIMTSTMTSADNSIRATFYTYSGNPTCLAYLYDGEESGLQEFMKNIFQGTTIDATIMQHGYTYIPATSVTYTGVFKSTLINAPRAGIRKGIQMLGSCKTHGFQLTIPVAACPGSVGSSITKIGNLDAIELVSADHYVELESAACGKWKLLGFTATAAAAV